MSDVKPRFLFVDLSNSGRLKDSGELDVAFAEGELPVAYTVDSTADNNLICTFDLTNLWPHDVPEIRERVETIVNDVWANWEGVKRPNYQGCRWID